MAIALTESGHTIEDGIETAVIDARFAGGPLIVATEPLIYDDGRVAVTVDGPGFRLALFAHEARDLSAALALAADTADRPATIRRHSDVDERLQELNE
ncbi:hypothetical protein [Microbacterium lacticum]